MAVRCKLGEIMKQRGIGNKEVVELTGISRNTISSLAAKATKQIDYDTLDGLCKGFGVTSSSETRITSGCKNYYEASSFESTHSTCIQ